MKKPVLRILVIAVIISINIGCDQSTKYLAKKHLPRAATIQVIDSFFILHYAENKGGFLSLFSSLPKPFRLILLSILPLIFLFLMMYYLAVSRELSSSYTFALCCIIGGGLSNIADRLFNEYVVDFINVGIGGIRSGILNFADLSITMGAAMIVYLVVKHKDNAAGGSLPS